MFTNPGFVFLLLPLSAVAYYLVPNDKKIHALPVISALIALQLEGFAWWVIPLLLLDALALNLAKNHPQSALCKSLPSACIVKNLCAAMVFGIVLPIAGLKAAPSGLFTAVLMSLYTLTLLTQGEFDALTPSGYLASVGFFAPLAGGPTADPRSITQQIEKPVPSLSLLGSGIMRFSLGIAKQVILSRQLMLLVKTLDRFEPAEITVLSAWLTAISAAMGIYFMLSGMGDVAVGIGEIFSIKLPRLTYYPLHAPSVRDYVYRMNLPAEKLLGTLLYEQFDRDDYNQKSVVVSAAMPFLLALWLVPTVNGVIWGCYLSALIVAEHLLLRRWLAKSVIISRVVTFLLATPSFLLLTESAFDHKLMVFQSLFGLSQAALFNDAAIYAAGSNAFLLIVAAASALSFFETLSRITRQQFPALWWVMSVLWSFVVMFVTTSFLIWNVR